MYILLMDFYDFMYILSCYFVILLIFLDVFFKDKLLKDEFVF